MRTLLISLIFISAAGAWASQAVDPNGKSVPCGVVEKVDGEAHYMNATRTQVVDLNPHIAIPCGSWISVQEGKVTFKHRQGFVVGIAAHSFAEVFDHEKDAVNEAQTGADHLILYRGKLHIGAGDGSGELRVVTPNGRVRMTKGTALVIYNQREEETQLIALEYVASLENRFEPNTLIKVDSGEATQLNLKALRVTPSAPAAMQVADVKGVLKEFLVTNSYASQVLERIALRKSRQYPIALEDRKEREERERSIASVKSKSEYSRHPVKKGFKPETDQRAEEQFMARLTGGVAGGDTLLFPDKAQAPQRRRPAAVIVEDPAAHLKKIEQTREEQEKRRLIDELSKIEVE